METKNKLIVGIGGYAGTGKSNLLFLLKNFLKDNGFEVEYKPNEFSDFENENDFDAHHNKHHKKAIEEIKNKTIIQVKELQLKRKIRKYG